MKKISLISALLFCMCSLKLSAQESVITEINYNTLEKYIQAAKDNPRREILGLNIEKAKADIPITTLGYLDMVNASYYYRPDDRVAIDINNPYRVNGFQFGVSTSLGMLLQRPFEIKKAKIDHKIAQLEAKDYDRGIGNLVKGKYYDYIKQVNQLKISSQAVLDNQNVADNLKRKFEKGEISLDVYNESRNALSSASSAKLQAEVDFLKSKDALEEIIGKKLEEIK
jgi:outer membrane protein TolC